MYLMKQFLDFINLHNGEENKKKVLENISANVSFKGANLWILACAIFVASVGLNVNSTAVIIGAMLISPLMGPIVGAGFALATYDFNLLKKSVKNLAVATLASLLVSSFYFFLSPFKETQSELLARTSPNIYDVLIAFLGGLVGVIAVTRVEKGNPVPGVAIATALMPPLCTAGYGLAIGNFSFFLGAFFLYSINCVFICIATFSIVKLLKYPISEEIELKHKTLIKYSISTIILIMLLPSIYFAFSLFKEKKYIQKVENFIEEEFTNRGYTIIYKKNDYKSSPKSLELAFLSKKFTEKEISLLNEKLVNYGLTQTKMYIKQDTSNLKNDILNEIGIKNNLYHEKDIIINKLQKELADLKFENASILSETKVLFPEIENLSVSNHTFFENTDTTMVIPIMLYQSKTELSTENATKLVEWLQVKLKKQQVKVLRFK